MSEYIIELPDSGAADEFVAKMGVEDCRIYGYRLTGEIVRCRDCERFQPKNGSMLACKFVHRGFVQWRSAEPDGFCAWGVRKENHAC